MTEHTHRIVVIGAGYAGLLATVRLAGKVKREIQRGAVEITLVNASDDFVERLRLHQKAANQTLPNRPIAGVLRGTGIAFMRGVVVGIDVVLHSLRVQTDAGTEHVGYDNLLYALGSTIDRDSVPGVRDYAYVLEPVGPNSACALAELLPRLNAAGQSGRILVCGGGATGIEAAAEFAESFPNLQVQLVTRGEFGLFMNKRVAGSMRRSLHRLGVTIQDQTTIVEVRAAEALAANGTVFPYDVCLWSGGFRVPHLAREAGLAVNEHGQILIDPFMRSISHPDVYAVGDAAQPVEAPGVVVRMAAFTAVVMGAHGADCLSATLLGQRPKPFSFAYAGQAIALGRHDAIGFNTYPSDSPNLPYFTGKTGTAIREFFVRLLADLPTIERQRPGFFVWLGKGRYAASKRRGQISQSPMLYPEPSSSPPQSHGV